MAQQLQGFQTSPHCLLSSLSFVCQARDPCVLDRELHLLKQQQLPAPGRLVKACSDSQDSQLQPAGLACSPSCARSKGRTVQWQAARARAAPLSTDAAHA